MCYFPLLHMEKNSFQKRSKESCKSLQSSLISAMLLSTYYNTTLTMLRKLTKFSPSFLTQIPVSFHFYVQFPTLSNIKPSHFSSGREIDRTRDAMAGSATNLRRDSDGLALTRGEPTALGKLLYGRSCCQFALHPLDYKMAGPETPGLPKQIIGNQTLGYHGFANCTRKYQKNDLILLLHEQSKTSVRRLITHKQGNSLKIIHLFEEYTYKTSSVAKPTTKPNTAPAIT